jgi:peptide/nickel transport system permease protein
MAAVLSVTPTVMQPRPKTAFRRLVARPLSGFGVFVLTIAVIVAVFAGILAPFDPTATDFSATMTPPSGRHWFGTDQLGRDQFSRVMFGVRTSMLVGLSAMFLSTLLGAALGVVAAYYRRVDIVVSRLTDVLLAFPFLVLAIGLAAIIGPSRTTVTVALAVGELPFMIRVVRGEALRLKEREYVEAAIAAGARDWRVMWGHIFPNAQSVVIVQSTITIPTVILGEALLSYLGLGIRPPEASLGVLLANSQSFIAQAPWLSVVPGLVIVFITLAFNLVGDGLRDVLDPKRGTR